MNAPLLLSSSGSELLSVVVVILVIVIGLVIYLVPSLIAGYRHHPNTVAILAVNLLLGWLCVGWIVAFVWSVTAIDESRTYR